MSVKETQAPSTKDIICVPILGEVSELSRGSERSTRQWTIKGLSEQTVEVSREAAKRSGMKVNAWVSSALNSAAHKNDFDADQEAAHFDVDNEPKIDLEILSKEFAILKADNEDMKRTLQVLNEIMLKIVKDRIK